MPLLKLVKSKVNFAKQTEEYYNAIRTNIQFSGAQMKVIAVSSVEAGEGKSTTSVNIAISFASVGLRTLLIDTPPIGLVIDAVIVAHQADASLLVTAAGKIKRRFVTKAVEQLTQSGSQFLGVVLNKVDMTVDKYGTYGSYGAYGDYGKKSEQKSSHSRSQRRRKG